MEEDEKGPFHYVKFENSVTFVKTKDMQEWMPYNLWQEHVYSERAMQGTLPQAHPQSVQDYSEASQDYAYCKNCGNQVLKTHKFCDRCGDPIDH